MFNEYFVRKSGSRSNIFQNSVASFHQNLPQPSPSQRSHDQPAIPAFDDQLSFLAQDMIETLVLRVGHLGCEERHWANRKFYVSSLAADTTATMFDTLENQTNALSAMGEHRMIQLVDIWFSAHPLSPLISKTLMVGRIKDGTADVVLIATILADACEIHCRTGGMPRSDEKHNCDDEVPGRLRQLAASQLKSRCLDINDRSSLSTAQALILMGWRELSLGHARRATCYIGYTCNIVARLNQLWESDGRDNRMKLNGVNVAEVEKELLRNTYWLCLSTTTWAFMQIDQPFSLLVPDETPDFPSFDESTSATLHLDRTSSNISTLPAQIRLMQQLWPLSHITSTVAHIYILYLNAAADDRKERAASWEKEYIHQLHHLLRARLYPSTLSLEIRGILLQAIHTVEREVSNISPQRCLLVSYHTIAIHMLFPGAVHGHEPPQVSETLIQAFCQTMSAILFIAQRYKSMQSTTDGGRMAVGVNTLVLAIDTCSRALLYIYEKSARGSQSEYNAATMMRNSLADYAEQLHRTCKIDLISLRRSAIRPVKKRLKQLKQSFWNLGSMASYQQTYAHTHIQSDTRDPLFISQGEHDHTLLETPLISLSAAESPDTPDCSLSIDTRPFSPVENPCLFVSEPGLGFYWDSRPLPRSTMLRSTFRQIGQIDGESDAQKCPSTPARDDALQYSVPDC